MASLGHNNMITKSLYHSIHIPIANHNLYHHGNGVITTTFQGLLFKCTTSHHPSHVAGHFMSHLSRHDVIHPLQHASQRLRASLLTVLSNKIYTYFYHKQSNNVSCLIMLSDGISNKSYNIFDRCKKSLWLLVNFTAYRTACFKYPWYNDYMDRSVIPMDLFWVMCWW